jgi:NAD(P)-dependent dehydrogenase (short-subunit alcohol dehydrogenase family)
MNLSGKRLLITGGAKRIGAAIARKMAQCGCRIALHCHNSAAEAEILLHELPGSGHTLHICDLAVPDAPEKLSAAVGNFDFLVNNAAVFFRPGSPEDTAAAALYDQINYQVPKQLLEIFYRNSPPDGAAVNITDCTALIPGNGAYWQSKYNLTRLTTELTLPWAERGLRINAIAPGAVLPPPWAKNQQMTNILAATPLHRATMPEDIADLCAFLLTCPSATGTIIPLDGALHLKK